MVISEQFFPDKLFCHAQNQKHKEINRKTAVEYFLEQNCYEKYYQGDTALCYGSDILLQRLF